MKICYLLFVLIICTSNAFSFSGKGVGSKDDPYQITNVQELQEMNIEPDRHYILMNDIDAGETRNWNLGDHDRDTNTPDEPMGFVPIGAMEEEFGFTGTFDGKGYKIKNLYINLPKASGVGLIKNTYDVTISTDILLINVFIEDCDITGGSNVGGLVGHNRTTIRKCYVTGKITGDLNIGGLAGTNVGVIGNSYAIADLQGNERVGGLVGLNIGFISNSYAAGVFSGSLDNAGGFVGEFDDSYAKIDNCFWDMEKSGVTKSAAGTGKSTPDMKTKATFTDAGWDFDNIWSIDENINDGYPNLENSIMSSDEDLDGINHRDIIVYPNPSKDNITIKLNNSDIDINTIVLVDLNGRELRHIKVGPGIGEVSISNQDLPKGLYYLKIINRNGNTFCPVILE